jgi:hypothetical protein
MIDQNSQFFAILTAVGEAKQANATALGQPWTFAQMGVGDANGADPMPSRTQTRLINEWRRAPVNQVRTDPANPNIIITEQVIPPDVGGKWIREIGLYDAAGDLVAVANCAPSFKSLLVQGTGKTQIIRMNFIVANTASVVLKIDPAVVLATREYVDLQIIEALAKLDFKNSVLVATTANIVLSGIQTVDGVLLSADSRVLVKDQAQAKDNGIYVVPAGGAWKRAQDADASVEVTPGLFVSVEKGAANGDSVWQLVTDAPIVLGTTALVFEMAVGRTGISAGSYASVTVDKYGRVIAGTNPTTLSGHGITDGLRVGVVSSQRPILAGNLPAKLDNNADGAGGAVSIREVNEVGADQTALEYAPAIHFHWKNLFARYLKMSSIGDLIWGAWKLWHEGNFDPAAKADLSSPTFTGVPKGPTAAAGTSTTQLATTAFTYLAVNAYATTVTASLALKADAATSLRVGSVSRQRPILAGNVAAGADNGADGTGGAIEIREVNEVGSAQASLLYGPGILFNWQNRGARYLKMSALSDLMWGDKKVFTEGNITDVLATVALQANGRVLIPTKDGTPLYLQWYEGPVSTAETVTYPAISHPVPFPNVCLFAGVFTRSTSGNTLSDQMFQVEYWDRLGVKVFPQWFGTGNQSLVKPLIFAIGY